MSEEALRCVWFSAFCVEGGGCHVLCYVYRVGGFLLVLGREDAGIEEEDVDGEVHREEI